MPPGPTAASEFRRGLNPYNLMVGAVAALALGAVTLVATLAGVAPDLLARGAATQALAAALGLFVIITGMHTATHTYFGWRFARLRSGTAAGGIPHSVHPLLNIGSPVDSSPLGAVPGAAGVRMAS